MQINALHHVNLITADQPRLIDFYRQVLGLTVGDRPPFEVNGTWLYLNEIPIIHLVETAVPYRNEEPQVNHYALTGQGLAEFIDRLRQLDIPYNVFVAPQVNIRQVEMFDPDGNKFEVLFDSAEEADLSPYKWPH